MEYKDLYPNKKMDTINAYENMVIEQKARLSKKNDMTVVELVKMLIDANRENEAMERIISQLTEEIQELEDAFAELTDDYNTLEDQFIRIGGAEDPAMRG